MHDENQLRWYISINSSIHRCYSAHDYSYYITFLQIRPHRSHSTTRAVRRLYGVGGGGGGAPVKFARRCFNLNGEVTVTHQTIIIMLQFFMHVNAKRTCTFFFNSCDWPLHSNY